MSAASPASVALALTLSFLSLSARGMAAAPVIVPEALETEHRVDPFGVDTPNPRLSWRLRTTMPEVRSQNQTAYRIVVATDDAFGRVVWDSGRVDSPRSANVSYAGTHELQAAGRYFWRVKTWYRAGAEPEAESDWSPVARWEMGLLRDTDWAGAEWIGLRKETSQPDVDYQGIGGRVSGLFGFSAPLLRRNFPVPDKPLERATLYICGLGYYEAYVNGRKVGDHVLDPGYTRYDRTALYVVHDVTALLLQDSKRAATANAVGVMLGRGFYGLTTPNEWADHRASWHGEPRLKMRLRMQFEDGEVRDVVSKGSPSRETGTADPNVFRAADGPIVFDSVRAGEIYDATRERPGWATAEYVSSRDYSAGHWGDAIRMPNVAGTLKAQSFPPVRVTGTIPAEKVVLLTHPVEGVRVYDMGRQMAGWARITVSGSRGDVLEIRYGQRLHNGRPDMVELAAIPHRGRPGTGAYQTDFYVLKGGSEETYEPRFSYKGFRYVDVIGRATVRKVEGRFVHTDVEPVATEPVGAFSTSNHTLNDFHAATRGSMLDNLHGIPTDCPHSEKNGWTAEDHLVGEAALYLFDVATLYGKRSGDFADDQESVAAKVVRKELESNMDGALRVVVPSNFGPDGTTEPAWEGSVVLLPWYSYLFNGDLRVLADSYPSMSRYVRSLSARSQGGLITTGTLNDWASPGGHGHSPEDPDLLQSAFYFHVADVFSTISERLGDSAAEDDPERRGYLESAAFFKDLARGDPATGLRRDGTDSIRKAFHTRFFDAVKNVYTDHDPKSGYRQTSNVLALHFGLVPEDRVDAVFQNLVNDILLTRNGHLDVGIFGLRYLADVLTAHGRSDVAYLVFTQPDFPSLSSVLTERKGTLAEWWDSSRARSLNHKMYGSAVGWMYRHVAGISYDAARPGFQRSVIQPSPGGNLTHAEGSHDSPYGRISSGWRLDGGRYTFAVTVPVNTSAEVRIPVQRLTDVLIEEGGVAVWTAGAYRPGVSGIRSCTRASAGFVSCDVASGSYSFRLSGRAPVASFNTVDSITGGTWRTVYGNAGFQVVGLPGARGTRLPPSLSVSMGGGTIRTWKKSTEDPVALQKPDGPERVAASALTTDTQVIDVNVTDGIETDVAIYFSSWEHDPVFTVDLVDPAIGDNAIDRRTVRESRRGVYLKYKVKGRARFRISRESGDYAAFSGVFFDRPATFLGTDAATQGAWMGVYGTDGYDIRGLADASNLQSRPPYVTALEFSAGATEEVSRNAAAEPGALQNPDLPPHRIAVRTSHATSQTIDVNVNHSSAKEVALYFLGRDSDGAFRVEAIDLEKQPDAILDSRTVPDSRGGIYLRYGIRGRVRFRITRVIGSTVGFSGIFFGRPALFLGIDVRTRGSWKTVYGSDGFDVRGVAEAENRSTRPSYATVRYSGGASEAPWERPAGSADLDRDERALQLPGRAVGRIAARRWAKKDQTIDLTVEDGQKEVALYFLGWDGERTLTVTYEKVHPVSGATLLLDSQTVDSLKDGVYLKYKVAGHVRFRIRKDPSSRDTVFSALFFDRSSRFVGSDFDTGGNWTTTYGADGYEIPGLTRDGGSKPPPYAEISYFGGEEFTWPDGIGTTDPRALQTPTNPRSRMAACRFAVDKQTIEVKVAGEVSRDVSIYFLDWDRKARALTVELFDFWTRALIDVKTLTNYEDGVYLSYRVRGRVLFRVTNTNGDNGAFSGVFFGRPKGRDWDQAETVAPTDLGPQERGSSR